MSLLKNKFARVKQWHRAILFTGMALLIFVVYWRLLPKLWPEPEVIIEPAGQVSLNADGTLPVKITVKAWHRNFYLSQVRFEGDWLTSTTLTPKDLLPLVVPFKDTAEEPPVNRFTSPATQTYTVDIPVSVLTKSAAPPLSPLQAEILAVIRYPISEKRKSDEDFNSSRWPWVTHTETAKLKIEYK